MWITYDPIKREQTLASRGLDFADASMILDGEHLISPDTRKNYGEPRFICYGMLHNRMVVFAYTPRGTGCHVFSMRKANEREKKRFSHLLRK
jgi:uncharacterized DUF497 family protein